MASPERQPPPPPLAVRASLAARRDLSTIRVLAIATQGAGSTDEARLRTMLSGFDAEIVPFNRAARLGMLRDLVRKIRTQNYEIVALEGTGIAGGLAAILGRLTAGVPYVVSTGDAVAPFLRRVSPLNAPFADLYERALYRLSVEYSRLFASIC